MIYTERVLIMDSMRSNTPTILLIVGSTPFEPLLAFFREKNFSISTERSYAQAAGRFIEWLSVRAHEFHSPLLRPLIYNAFLHDMRFGTHQEGSNAYELQWRSTTHQNLNRLLSRLIDFSDWLSQRYGTIPISPIGRQTSVSDQIVFWRRWNKRKAGSIFSHFKSRVKATQASDMARAKKLPRPKNSFTADVKAFPAERLDDLLWKGFINPGKAQDTRPWVKYNIRDILITLLCAYGGCRPSEPLHLWLDDVYVDPDDSELALVLIHEPSDGKVEYTDPITGARRNTTRLDYLQRFCGGRKPLDQETGRRHSGWKGSLLTHRERQAFQVFWVDKNAGRLFLRLWHIYIQHVRAVTPQIPWAFLTKDAQPMGVEAFQDSFNAAVRRIGLWPSKTLGTTSHGPRHRYGQWIEELGLNEKEGQVAMHHRNVNSQNIYRQSSVAAVAAVMGKIASVNIPPAISEYE